MTRRSLRLSVAVALFGWTLAAVSPAWAADSPVGEWVKTAGSGGPVGLTLTIESWGKGKAKLTYRMKGANMVMVIKSSLDGKDAPVMLNGKDSGETMAITLVDKHHTATVIKVNGQQFATSKAAWSDDFNKVTVENDTTSAVGGMPVGKSTETWVRK